MKRFSLVNIIGTGADKDPWRADVAGDWVCVQAWPKLGKVLVKQSLPDGTAMTANTVADVLADAKDATVQLDVSAVVLATTQRNTVKTWLVNQGFDLTGFPNVTDRKALLLAVMEYLAKRECDIKLLLSGYDIS